MKILIADDDDYTREGIVESIDWERYGIDEPMQAQDGAEALRLSLAHKPDIVLTDIRMPKLNGIEFTEKLIAACPDSKLLFMSGYMDVDYLKSAIKLSVVDYIEKPIKLPELEQAIGKTVEHLRENERHRRILDQKIALERHRLAGALRSPAYEGELIERLCASTGYPADLHYVGIVVEGGGTNRSEEVEAYWRKYAVPCIGERLDPDREMFIVAFRRQDAERIKYLTEALSRSDDGFTVGMGTLVTRLEDVQASCQVALCAAERSFFRPDTRFFAEGRTTVQQSIRADKYLDFFKLLKKEPDKLVGWVDSVCDVLTETESPGRERLVSYFTSFAQAMLDEKNGLMLRLDGIYEPGDVERRINACRSLPEIKRFMVDLCTAYQEEVEQASQYSRTVRDVMSYVAAHCGNVDLDVREIAERMHLSTAHLGVLFKQETEMTIKQYISDYRIEQAKKLIESEHYKMNEITEMCGYTSASYFAKVFKASTDLTPVEYRNRKLR